MTSNYVYLDQVSFSKNSIGKCSAVNIKNIIFWWHINSCNSNCKFQSVATSMCCWFKVPLDLKVRTGVKVTVGFNAKPNFDSFQQHVSNCSILYTVIDGTHIPAASRIYFIGNSYISFSKSLLLLQWAKNLDEKRSP